MGLFDEVGNLAGQAQKLAKEHPDQVKAALDKAEQLADDRTGHRFTSQIQAGADQASKALDGQDLAPAPQAPAAPTDPTAP